jgi:hypothetical protein
MQAQEAHAAEKTLGVHLHRQLCGDGPRAFQATLLFSLAHHLRILGPAGAAVHFSRASCVAFLRLR